MSTKTQNFVSANSINYATALANERKVEEERLHLIVSKGSKLDYETYKGFCEKNNRKAPESKGAFKAVIKEYKTALNYKIKNYSKKWGDPVDYIKQEIVRNKPFARNFVVEPNRQTFHQHCAADFIKQLPTVSNFKELYNAGDKSFYVMAGQLFRGKNIKDMMTNQKSLDFTWNYRFKNKKLTFFASHKFTQEDGGAQTEQYSDICNYLIEAKKNRNENIVFLSITDGEFYTKDHKRKGYNKMEQMHRYFNGDYCRSTTSNELLNDMIPFIEGWLKKNFTEEEYKDEVSRLESLKTNI